MTQNIYKWYVVFGAMILCLQLYKFPFLYYLKLKRQAWSTGTVYARPVIIPTQIAKFMGPTWGPPGFCRPQMGPMLAPWALLSGYCWRDQNIPAQLYH